MIQSQQDIERYVEDLLTVSGFRKDGADRHLWVLLHHLYSAVAMYEHMSVEDKVVIATTQKKLRYFFESKCELKERRRKGLEKEKKSPTPPIKEKDTPKVEAEKMCVCAERKISGSLEERKETFRKECLAYVDQYDNDRLRDFFNYYSQENRSGTKMRFESVRFWNTKSQMDIWMQNDYSSKATNAAMQLRKTKKKVQGETAAAVQQEAVAAQRKQANVERELAQEQSKQGQMLTADYLAKNPNGLMAQWAKEREQKEKLKQHEG